MTRKHIEAERAGFADVLADFDATAKNDPKAALASVGVLPVKFTAATRANAALSSSPTAKDAPRLHPGGRRRFITYEGETLVLSQWADRYGMSRKTLITRLDRDGMSFAQAIAKPVNAHSTPEEVAERRNDIKVIIEGLEHPVTVRQIFYRAVVDGIVKKTESGYKTIGEIIKELRESETIPWDWIADNTRRVIEYDMLADLSSALRHSADTFMRDPWCDADVSVAIWMEKDALAGVIETITLPLGVPLFVCKGFASLSFIKAAAERFNRLDRPVYHYHLGDFDPSGRGACEALRERLEDFSDVKARFKSLALDQDQIDKLKLPSRETKGSDTRLEWFVRKYGTDSRIETLDADLEGMSKEEKQDHLLTLSPDSVELDAMEPDELRSLVRGAIMKHTSRARMKENALKEAKIQDRLTEIADDEEELQ